LKTLFPYAFFIGSAQGFLLAFFLFRKKENRVANRLLAVTLFLFAIDLILEALAVTGEIKKIPILIGVMQTLPYLYGPSIYLYVHFITHGIKKFNYKYLFHFTPFVLVQIYALFFFYFEPTSYQTNLVYLVNELPWHVLLVSYITPFYGIFYIILAIYEAYEFNKKLKNNFSNIEKHNLSWIKFLLIGAVLLWITAVFMSILQIVYGKEIHPELTSYLAISVFIYAIAYKGLMQPEATIKKIEDTSNDEKLNSYKKSGLKDEDTQKHLTKLLKIMDEQKPFKNEKLSLLELAELVGISTHNLSEIINTKIEQNFYDFVNSYRVEEVKQLIIEDKGGKYNILAHGFEAGFSSKTAYYSAFKKFVNKTPAQFRKEILNI